MTLSTATIAYLQTTDAEFRTWGQAIHDGLTTGVGLTHVAQTGEIDFSTVLKPSATNQQRGFKMYKLNDGLTELYIKVTFGSGNDGATQPEPGFQIGFAIDGSGGFTGSNFSQRGGCRFTAGSYATRFCKRGDIVTFNVGDNQFWVVERDRNPTTGAATANGASLVIGSNGSSVLYSVASFIGKGGQEYVASSGGFLGLMSGSSWFVYTRPPTGATWARSGTMNAMPLFPWDAPLRAPHAGLVVVSPTDLAVASNADVTLYGTSRRYRAVNHYADNSSFGRFALLDDTT